MNIPNTSTGYNPMQFVNPIIINTNNSQHINNGNNNYIMQQPMLYNNHNSNQFMAQQQVQQQPHPTISSVTGSYHTPRNLLNMQRQSMQRQQFQQTKMPNPTSWNVGGI